LVSTTDGPLVIELLDDDDDDDGELALAFDPPPRMKGDDSLRHPREVMSIRYFAAIPTSPKKDGGEYTAGVGEANGLWEVANATGLDFPDKGTVVQEGDIWVRYNTGVGSTELMVDVPSMLKDDDVQVMKEWVASQRGAHRREGPELAIFQALCRALDVDARDDDATVMSGD
jgi:hypothetical protein